MNRHTKHTWNQNVTLAYKIPRIRSLYFVPFFGTAAHSTGIEYMLDITSCKHVISEGKEKQPK